MNKKIMMLVALMVLISIVGIVYATEQERYNIGYTPTAICGNNICEKMYFEIDPNDAETHKINGQDIVIKTETSNEENPRTAFSFNEVKDRLGGDAKEINSQLKSKYGFAVSSINGMYDQEKWPDEQIPLYYQVEIFEENYCPEDCMDVLGRISLEQGWNMVSEGVLTDLRLNNINDDFNYESDISAVYQYVPVLNKYKLMKPRDSEAEKKINNELLSKVGGERTEKIIEQKNKAVWAYSNKKIILYYKKDSNRVNIDAIDLFDGWNFVAMTPEMSEKNLNQIKGNCNIEKFYMFVGEGNNNGWTENLADFLANRPLDDDWIGQGFVVKVTDDCTLGTSGGTIPSVPNLP